MHGEIDQLKNDRQHHDLEGDRTFFRVQKLWEQGQVEQRHFRVQQIGKETLSEYCIQ